MFLTSLTLAPKGCQTVGGNAERVGRVSSELPPEAEKESNRTDVGTTVETLYENQRSHSDRSTTQTFLLCGRKPGPQRQRIPEHSEAPRPLLRC